MRPDGSRAPPDLPSVLRLILTITHFLCNQTAVTAEGTSFGAKPVNFGRRANLP